MRREFLRCSIPTVPRILLSFSPSRPRLFLSDLTRSVLVIRTCTPNYRAIFIRIQSNILLRTRLVIDSDSNRATAEVPAQNLEPHPIPTQHPPYDTAAPTL